MTVSSHDCVEFETLDNLEKIAKSNKYKKVLKSLVWELYSFAIFFIIMFVCVVIFVNYNVFYSEFREKILWEEIEKDINIVTNIKNDISLWDLSLKSTWSTKDEWVLIWNNHDSSEKDIILNDSSEKILKTRSVLKEIEKTLWSMEWLSKSTTFEREMNYYLKWKIKNYSFNFNLLPPDNRLIVSEIWINVPIIDLPFTSKEKLENADFDEELFWWVVKYPYTPRPWLSWNTLIFWHTSYYWWKNNPYWDIFSKLPKLQEWSKIEVVRKWKMIEYVVEEKIITWPNKVWEEYESFVWWDYLTLMWCYPIWTDARRILVVWKETKSSEMEELAMNDNFRNNSN